MSSMRVNLITYFPRYWMVAFAGASLAYGNAQEHRLQFATFVFLGIFLVYNRYLSIESKYGIRGKLIIICLLSFCLYLGLQLVSSPILFSTLLVSGLLGFFYTQRLPIVGIALRDIPGLKTVLVVGVWTYITCLLPALLGKTIYPLITYALPGLFILAISLLFDLRDRKIDNASRKTIPQLIGEPATKIVVIILLVSYLILNQLFNIVIFLDWIYAAVLLLLTLLFAFKDTKSTYYGTLLELTLVVLGVGYW
jgi:hypothetical protein